MICTSKFDFSLFLFSPCLYFIFPLYDFMNRNSRRDSGPNWIHGTGDNPIMAIAEATKTLAHDPEGENIAIAPDGQLISDDVSIKVAEFVWMTIGEAFEYSNRHGESIPPDRSLFDFLREKLQQTQFSEVEKELCLDACKLWGAYVGDPIGKQSLKFFCLEECIDGSMYSCWFTSCARSNSSSQTIILLLPVISTSWNISPKQRRPRPTSNSTNPSSASTLQSVTLNNPPNIKSPSQQPLDLNIASTRSSSPVH